MRKLTTQELVSAKPSPSQFRRLPRFPLSIVLDNVRSLENVGLIFRLADAVRAEKLYLTGITGYPSLGKKDPRLPHISERADRLLKKTAIHLIPFVPWEYHQDIVSLVKKLKSQGNQIVVLEQTTQSQNYTAASYQFPLALILGHERLGVTSQTLNLADLVIEIPMFGFGNNLNVATALAVIIYKLAESCAPKTQ